VLFLDEPTTGLDVTTQEQIISLLSELRGRIGVAIRMISTRLRLDHSNEEKLASKKTLVTVPVERRSSLRVSNGHPGIL
jgi:peptide/nickel transport system ATP-binding protein